MTVDLFGFTLSDLEFLALTVGSILIGYLAESFYLNLDKKTEIYALKCRNIIEENPAFRSVTTRAASNIIATSDSRLTQARTRIKSALLSRDSRRPQKVVPLESRSMEERRKVILFERIKEIFGTPVIDKELLGCIRNYYAFKLAVERDGFDSETAVHYLEKFRNYEHANRVRRLDSEEHYRNISLIDEEIDGKNTLDDVFLRIIRGANDHCVGSTDSTEVVDTIDECRAMVMGTFFDLYSQRMKGLEMPDSMDIGDCVGTYRTDVREEDHVGYWLLPESNCTEAEFKRFRSAAWKTQDVLDGYWKKENFSPLYPTAARIPDMPYVRTPFIVFRKDLEKFRYASKTERIHGEEKHRKKL